MSNQFKVLLSDTIRSESLMNKARRESMKARRAQKLDSSPAVEGTNADIKAYLKANPIRRY